MYVKKGNSQVFRVGVEMMYDHVESGFSDEVLQIRIYNWGEGFDMNFWMLVIGFFL